MEKNYLVLRDIKITGAVVALPLHVDGIHYFGKGIGLPDHAGKLELLLGNIPREAKGFSCSTFEVGAGWREQKDFTAEIPGIEVTLSEFGEQHGYEQVGSLHGYTQVKDGTAVLVDVSGVYDQLQIPEPNKAGTLISRTKQDGQQYFYTMFMNRLKKYKGNSSSIKLINENVTNSFPSIVIESNDIIFLGYTPPRQENNVSNADSYLRFLVQLHERRLIYGMKAEIVPNSQITGLLPTPEVQSIFF